MACSTTAVLQVVVVIGQRLGHRLAHRLLGGKMDHRRHLVLAKDAREHAAVAHVALHEGGQGACLRAPSIRRTAS